MGVNSPNPNPPTATVNFQVNTIKDAINITAIAAALLALTALIGLIAPIHSRLGQLQAEIRHFDEQAAAQHQEILDEFRRFTEVINSHRHPPDGKAIFTAPPRAHTQPGQSNPGTAPIPPQSGANPTQTPTPQEPK